MYHNPNHSLLALLLLLLLLPIIPTFPSSTNSSLSNLHKSIIHIFNFTRRRRFALSGTKVFFFLFVYLFIWPHLQPSFPPSAHWLPKGHSSPREYTHVFVGGIKGGGRKYIAKYWCVIYFLYNSYYRCHHVFSRLESFWKNGGKFEGKLFPRKRLNGTHIDAFRQTIEGTQRITFPASVCVRSKSIFHFFCFFVSKLLRYYTPLALVFGECTSNRWKMDRQHLRSVVTFHFCWGLRRRRCVWKTFFQVYRNGAPDQDRSVSPTWAPRNLSFELILFRLNFPPDCQSWVRKITPLSDKS